MAFGWGGVYGVTKVVGENLCRMVHESIGAAVAMLRYHDFAPKLLRGGIDRPRCGEFDRRRPPRDLWPGLVRGAGPGAKALIAKYDLEIPESLEQHDFSEVQKLLSQEPEFDFVEILEDLKAHDARDEDVRAPWVPGQIPA